MFEYLILDPQWVPYATGQGGRFEEVTLGQLNEAGAQGWRLAAAVPSPYVLGNQGTATRYVFERQR